MGLDRAVSIPAGAAPAWDEIKLRLVSIDEPAPLRMIDGQPAFPDDVPDAGWRELRVGAGGGMITIRRAPGFITCVVWSSADPALLAARDRVAWACAAAAGGTVQTDTGSAVSPTEFAQQLCISPA